MALHPEVKRFLLIFITTLFWITVLIITAFVVIGVGIKLNTVIGAPFGALYGGVIFISLFVSFLRWMEP